jgi:S-formylglutathione hydrolase FrmB
MKVLTRTALAGAVAAAAVTVPVAQARTALPVFADGFGLTVVSRPVWVEGSDRTFTVTVRSTAVPRYQPMQYQKADEHVVMVTLPAGYDGADETTRYPVQYTLHGHQDYPNTQANLRIAEQATEGVPLITVQPNGGGRGWYSNWVDPGSLGPQNWETFHLDQLIPFVDANLRTVAARDGRVISGHSMGGFGAFHYAEHRPELFSYVGSFSGGLDLLNQEMRAAVAATTQLPASGTPTVPIDAIFGPPVWPLDGVWNAQSPAQHVGALRGMGVAMYVGNGGDLADNPVQAVLENRARATALVTADHLRAAGIPFEFADYGDGSTWAPGCTGKHAQLPCLQADMDHFVSLAMVRLRHP